MKKIDVFAIGNALIDFLIEVDHDKLKELNLNPGQFNLVGEEDSKKIIEKNKNSKTKIAPAGSSANTIRGIAMLGGNACFCGKVGKDEHGTLFEEEMIEKKINPNITRSEKMTGHVIAFITPDNERTFVGHLGAALDMKKSDIFLEDLKRSKILYVEGFMLEDIKLREVALHAMDFAKEHNIKIGIDLNDSGIIERNKDFIKEIVEKYADIVFANEDEAEAITGLPPSEALNQLSKTTEMVIVKIGTGGSLIKCRDKTYKIPLYKVNAIDTTGAGDMYAAGFLYGLCQNYDLNICGHLGSYFAAKVVEQIGAILKNIDRNEIEKIINIVNKKN